MTTSATPLNVEPGAPSSDSLLRRSTRRVPHGFWYALVALGVALAVVLVQIALYTQRTEPRDSRAIVERELRLNTLEPGERVVRSLPVFRRAPTEYYRQTRGLLVLTDRRLVYLGAPPRDVTGASDAPPTFDQREFRIDTAVTIEPATSVLGLARALSVESPEASVELAVPAGYWPKAQLMMRAWEGRHAKLAAIGVWGARVREARAELARVIQAWKKEPVHHEVRPGDALSSIAAWYETTPESLRALNGIEGNKIKVGQRLIIRK
jgi:hypothetical protein